MAVLLRSKFSSIWYTPYSKLTTKNATEREVETGYKTIALNAWDKSRPTRFVNRRRSKSRLDENSREDIREQTTVVSPESSRMSKSDVIHRPLIEDTQDSDRDVTTCLGITIGLFAALSGLGGIGAIVMLKALEVYRSDIDGIYMACYPFIFPAITGVAMAYKRKMGSLTIHFGVLLFGMAGGCIFYGFSVLPVYENQTNCTFSVMTGDCDKPILVYLYIAFGGIGAVFSIFGLLVSMCACCQASKTIAQRKIDEEIRHQMQQEKDRESRKQTKAAGQKSNYNPTSSNGSAKQNGGYDNLALTVDERIMTKL